MPDSIPNIDELLRLLGVNKTFPSPAEAAPQPQEKNRGFLRNLLVDFVGTLSEGLKSGAVQKSIGAGLRAGTSRGGTKGQAFAAAFGALPEAEEDVRARALQERMLESLIKQREAQAQMVQVQLPSGEVVTVPQAQAGPLLGRIVTAQQSKENLQANIASRERIAALGRQTQENIAKLNNERLAGAVIEGGWVQDEKSATGYSRLLVNRQTRQPVGVQRDILPPAGYLPKESVREAVVEQADGSLKVVPLSTRTGARLPIRSQVTANAAKEITRGVVEREKSAIVGQKRPTAEATMKSEAARSGLKSLDRLEKLLGIERDDQGNITAIRNKELLVMASLPGALSRGARALKNEAADVQTRIRTGAALNKQEQAFYISQLPTMIDLVGTDDDVHATIQTKLDILREYFTALATLPSAARVGNATKSNFDFRPKR